MQDIGLRSYQDIKTPDEIEEDYAEESYYQALLNEFDPEAAAASGCSFETYKRNCRKMARARRYGRN